MIIDGISDAHRATWSRLTRLHTASVALPTQTTRVLQPKLLGDESGVA
ncbi:hypothetical protein [Curtobacterium pusillum]|nr:hypothetical protein [Curtobacterium pusillum]